MDKSEIIETVKRHLQERHLNGITISVVEQGVRNDQDWWYVPVRADREPRKAYEYYETLAEIEDELKNQDKLDVVLVPAA